MLAEAKPGWAPPRNAMGSRGVWLIFILLFLLFSFFFFFFFERGRGWGEKHRLVPLIYTFIG